MRKEQYIFTWNDESYTYPSLIIPIIKYIEEFRKNQGGLKKKKEDLIIWCPFDVTEDTKYIWEDWEEFIVEASNYYKILKEEGYNVITSHIANWQDFFKYKPEDFDIIISNPPFKNKRKFFERALSFWKPFALLNPASWLNDGWVYNLFSDLSLQLLMPNARAKFFRNWKPIWDRPSFKAIYYCKDFLVNWDIKWFKLDTKLDNIKKETKIPSKMNKEDNI